LTARCGFAPFRPVADCPRLTAVDRLCPRLLLTLLLTLGLATVGSQRLGRRRRCRQADPETPTMLSSTWASTVIGMCASSSLLPPARSRRSPQPTGSAKASTRGCSATWRAIWPHSKKIHGSRSLSGLLTSAGGPFPRCARCLEAGVMPARYRARSPRAGTSGGRSRRRRSDLFGCRGDRPGASSTGTSGAEPADHLVGPDGVDGRPRRTLAQGAEKL
jgi:hypothetical protein